MYYRCNECGTRFERPKIISEYRGEYWGFPAYEEICVCPHCREDNIEIEEDEHGKDD